MKLATFIAPGREEPLAGVVAADRVSALGGGVRVVDVLAGAEPALGSDSWALSEVTLLAPVPDPGTIYAIGLNYAKHIAETGGQTPEAPIVFVKVRGSLAAPGAPIVCPEVVRRLDYEGELTIVMGPVGRSPATASPTTSPHATFRRASRSGLAPRAPTRSARWVRGSPPPTRCPIPTTCRCGRG